MDEEEELKKLVGGDGALHLYFGGYEIQVTHRHSFKWAEVFDCLFRCGYSVFVTRREGHLVIVAKQVY